MYLPALVYLGFDAGAYPEGFAEKHGLGFNIDREKDRVISKFTCGLAILWAVPYLLGALVAEVFSLDVEPYSYYFLFFINLAAAFYILMGLRFFRKWLEFYVDHVSSLVTMLIVFFGTNLYYYVLDESLMSHMYSFSLFSIALFTFKSYTIDKKFKDLIFVAISISLAILIRPTNVLFILILLLFDIKNWIDLKGRLSLLITPKNILVASIILGLILLPQLLYWNYVHDKIIIWTYENEGFIYWKNPYIIKELFAARSGLFPYSPILLIPVLYSIVMIFKRQANGALVFITFLVVIYMCGSWIDPSFGICNFGLRPTIEYLPIFIFPYAIMVQSFRKFKIFSKYLFVGLSVFFVIYTQVLFMNFNTCFFWGIWDWQKFWELLI